MASSSAEKESSRAINERLDLCVCNNSGHSRGVKGTMNLFINVCVCVVSPSFILNRFPSRGECTCYDIVLR